MRILTKVSFISAFMLTSLGAVAQEAENTPPLVQGIPGETIDEGNKFAPIKLDSYVTDDFDKPEKIKWSVSGNKQLKVSISPERIATIEIPSKYWNGSEDITFIATDTKGATGSETVNFNVESVNDPPEVKQIPDQTIDEGKTFAKIKLDEFVSDPDHPKNQILWEFDITPIGNEQADDDLYVEVDPNRVATIIIPDPHWYGSAKIKFTATDGESASDSKTATFTVKPINDAPVLQKIPDQTIDEKNEFEAISLTDFVSDVDDDVVNLKWSISGNKDLKFDIDKYGTATITIPNVYWNGSETITFTVTDPAGASAKASAKFTVKSVNDAPEFVTTIPPQTISATESDIIIALEDYIIDYDHSFDNLKIEISGNTNLDASYDETTHLLSVSRKIEDWSGSETLTIKATDPVGESCSCDVVFSVQPSLAVLSITDDQNGKTATFNALNTASVVITEPINVKKVNIFRNFTKERPSTMILPFGCAASKFDGIGTFHTISRVEYNQSTKEWEAKASEAVTSIAANTPYLFLPAKTISAENPIEIEAEEGSFITLEANNSTEPYTNVGNKENTTLQSDWELIGVYQTKKWTEDSKNEYGFSALDVPEDGISPGEFVLAGSGAWIKPMRCYLKYTGKESQFLSKSSTILPQSIRVIFPKATASVIDNDEQQLNPSESGVVTPISEINAANVAKVWSFNKTIYIESQPDTQYQIVDLVGRILKKGVTTSTHEEISLHRSGIVIVTIGNKSFKISL